MPAAPDRPRRGGLFTGLAVLLSLAAVAGVGAWLAISRLSPEAITAQLQAALAPVGDVTFPGGGAPRLVVGLEPRIEFNLIDVAGERLLLVAGRGRYEAGWLNLLTGMGDPGRLLLEAAVLGRADSRQSWVSVLQILPQDAGPAVELPDATFADLPAVQETAITLDAQGRLSAKGAVARAQENDPPITFELQLAPGNGGQSRRAALRFEGPDGLELSWSGRMELGSAFTATGALELAKDDWRLRAERAGFDAGHPFLAGGILSGPAGRANVEADKGAGDVVAVRIGFGAFDAAHLDAAWSALSEFLAQGGGMQPVTVTLGADVLAWGDTPLARAVALQLEADADGMRMASTRIGLSAGGEIRFEAIPSPQGDRPGISGALYFTSPFAARELQGIWPADWPPLPDGALELSIARMHAGADFVSLRDVVWREPGSTAGQITALDYLEGGHLSLQGKADRLVLPGAGMESLRDRLVQALDGMPPVIDLDLAADRLSLGALEARGARLAVTVDRAVGDGRLDAALGDLLGASVQVTGAIAVDGTLSGQAVLHAMSGPALTELAQAYDAPALAAFSDIALSLSGQPAALAVELGARGPQADLTLSGNLSAVLSDPAFDGHLAGAAGPLRDLFVALDWTRRGASLRDGRGRWEGNPFALSAGLECRDAGGQFVLSLDFSQAIPWRLALAPALGLTPDGNLLASAQDIGLLPCRPGVLNGSLRAPGVTGTPMPLGTTRFEWESQAKRMVLDAASIALPDGGHVELGGAVPLAGAQTSETLWLTLFGLTPGKLFPARDLIPGGTVSGDLVLDVPPPDQGGLWPLHAIKGQASLDWNAAEARLNLDPNGLGRLANARALAAYLSQLSDRAPDIRLTLDVQDARVLARDLRWNTGAGPLSLRGSLPLTPEGDGDLHILLDRPGFPAPYLALGITGSVAAPRIRAEGSWLQPR